MASDYITALTDTQLNAGVSFSNILVPIDAEHVSQSEKAIGMAAKLCQDSGAKLYLLNIAPPLGRNLAEAPSAHNEKADLFCGSHWALV